MKATKNHVCSCGGELQRVDASGHSQTTLCKKCRYCSLIVHHPNFELCILLADFHLKRGDLDGQRPLGDLGMATHLVDCLTHDVWPSPATIVDFGIDTPRHLGALQHAVGAGITAYDLDRVMGDGLALTPLIRSVPDQPYGNVEFETPYDALAGTLSWTE